MICCSSKIFSKGETTSDIIIFFITTGILVPKFLIPAVYFVLSIFIIIVVVVSIVDLATILYASIWVSAATAPISTCVLAIIIF